MPSADADYAVGYSSPDIDFSALYPNAKQDPDAQTSTVWSNPGDTASNGVGSAIGTGSESEQGATHNPLAALFSSSSKGAKTGGTSNLGLNPYGYNLPFKVPDWLAKYLHDLEILAVGLGAAYVLYKVSEHQGRRRRA